MAKLRPQRTIYPDPDVWVAFQALARADWTTASALNSRLMSAYVNADPAARARFLRLAAPPADNTASDST